MRRYRKSLPTPAFSPADADAVMLRFMSAYSVPGAALALIKDGRIVVEKGYGFRDLETHAPAWSRRRTRNLTALPTPSRGRFSISFCGNVSPQISMPLIATSAQTDEVSREQIDKST
jgi:hypothetical protein